MTASHNTGGARALLFERLVDHDLHVTEESPPFRVLSRQKLRESVTRELGQLLNSRCPVPLHLICEEERTAINYGIPDFTSLSPHSADDRHLIASIIGQTITAFEPRLRNVRVTAEYLDNYDHKLQITVEADLVRDTVIEIRSYPEFGSSFEPISFPIVLNSKTGIIEIYGNRQ
jgi:type VI secretion system protein ImpF